MRIKSSRLIGFAIITIIYIVAVIFGIWVYNQTSSSIYIKILAADVAATVTVYLFSLLFKNASVYDPYWSVAPIIILPLIALQISSNGLGTVLMLTAVTGWGVRLTYNWAKTFKNLSIQDWRYDMLKQNSKGFFPLVSFFGIQVFPTAVVYLCMLPAISFLQKDSLNLLTVFGFAICFFAVLLQGISDYEMHEFRKKTQDRSIIMREGLWKNCRHPNYLGEILMWWGVYVMMMSSQTSTFYFAAGPVINTLMFIFISIPMAEKRLASYKKDFDKYIEETRVLIPLPKPLFK
jgi:steroid 5-alpha reductase family enzyme